MVILDAVIEIIRGEYRVTYNGTEFDSFDAVKAAAKRPSRVVADRIECVDGILCVVLIDSPILENSVDDAWAAEYQKQFGREPSLF